MPALLPTSVLLSGTSLTPLPSSQKPATAGQTAALIDAVARNPPLSRRSQQLPARLPRSVLLLGTPSP